MQAYAVLQLLFKHNTCFKDDFAVDRIKTVDNDVLLFEMLLFCCIFFSRKSSVERVLTDLRELTSSWTCLDDPSLCLLMRNEERMKLKQVSTTFVICK